MPLSVRFAMCSVPGQLSKNYRVLIHEQAPETYVLLRGSGSHMVAHMLLRAKCVDYKRATECDPLGVVWCGVCACTPPLVWPLWLGVSAWWVAGGSRGLAVAVLGVVVASCARRAPLEPPPTPRRPAGPSASGTGRAQRRARSAPTPASCCVCVCSRGAVQVVTTGVCSPPPLRTHKPTCFALAPRFKASCVVHAVVVGGFMYRQVLQARRCHGGACCAGRALCRAHEVRCCHSVACTHVGALWVWAAAASM